MEKLDEAVEYIRNMEGKISSQAREFREKERVKIIGVSNEELNGSIVAVDSGFVSTRFHGVDAVIARAVGVNFLYQQSKLQSVLYYPLKNPMPKLEMRMGLEESEAACFRQLFRLQEEVGLACKMLEETKPKMLLIDGSLLPLPSDKPAANSVLFVNYEKLLAQYKQLYELAKQQGCTLVGVVKDTRSKRFVNSLDLPIQLNDGLFFHYYLQKGERTETKRYEDSKDDANANTLAKHISIFYLKSSDSDIPLRIEFLDMNNENEVAGIIYTLSSFSPAHAYPPPLVEADLRAMIRPEELERLESSLHLRLPSLHALRRNARPFR